MSLINFSKNRFPFFICIILIILFWELHYKRYYGDVSLEQRNENLYSEHDFFEKKRVNAGVFKDVQHSVKFKVSDKDVKRLKEEARNHLIAMVNKRMIRCLDKNFIVTEDPVYGMYIYEISEKYIKENVRYTTNHLYRANGKDKADEIYVYVGNTAAIEYQKDDDRKYTSSRSIARWTYKVKNNQLSKLPTGMEAFELSKDDRKHSCSDIPFSYFK
jgi:hypothetical protein